jgi:DEAD/DEAH box helicase
LALAQVNGAEGLVPIDFNKLTPLRAASRPVDPINLFQSLRVNDPAINDLWLAQGDALRAWDEVRAEPDVAIVLNTGAGKTLVGLLSAQSIVNETSGHVAYACSSIQLVRQTANKASGYGLEVTTYVGGNFNNDLYHQGLAPCITTYHALFNGRSRFFTEDLSAVVFDDAHTAGHLLRDQFTLRISSEGLPHVFTKLIQLFRPYFTRIGQESGFLDTQDYADAATLWFVPPFAVREQLAEIQRILRGASLREVRETMFSWEHLRDHIDLCVVFVSGTDVWFTPVVIPVSILPYFQPGVRRLYLSATLAAEDAFLRAFGRIPVKVIAPPTSAGECERLFLIPALRVVRENDEDDVEVAKKIAEGHKCLVLVPTRHRAKEWDEFATEHREDVAEQVEYFKTANPPACLVLTARYDGVDLPGDTCRLLVIDGLPTGLNPLERYLWERLGLLRLLRSTIDSRLVQSFGRISRGMSDHGVILLTGERLVSWILSPKNRALLPQFLQRQLELGIHISRQATTFEDLRDVTRQCLSRDEQWIKFYRGTMEDLDARREPPEDTNGTTRISAAEAKFGDAFWRREYAIAAKALDRELEATFSASRPAGAWHALWLGYCYDLLGDSSHAQELYSWAHHAERTLPPFNVQPVTEDQANYPTQVMAVSDLLQTGTHGHLELSRRFDIELAGLDGAGTVPQVENALQYLGTYLGLDTQRPDNEFGSGPDVLWSTPKGPALSMEAKTEKGQHAVYRKDDLGQLRDHLRWVREQLGETEVWSAFVGPTIAASPDSNPDPDMVVIELDAFRFLRDRLRSALIDICTVALPVTVASTVESVFAERGLLWPQVYNKLPKQILRDI